MGGKKKGNDLPRCGWNPFSFSYIFAQELKAGFADEAGTYGKDRLLVTAAVPVGKATIDAGYEIAAIAKYEAFYDQNIRLSYTSATTNIALYAWSFVV